MDKTSYYYCFITTCTFDKLCWEIFNLNINMKLISILRWLQWDIFNRLYIICKIRSHNVDFFPKYLSADALNTISEHWKICFPKYKFNSKLKTSFFEIEAWIHYIVLWKKGHLIVTFTYKIYVILPFNNISMCCK